MNIKNLDALNILAKGVGIAGLGIVAVDSHHYGKVNSASYQKKVRAEGLSDTYMNTRTLDTPSIVQSKIKDKYMNYRLTENLSDFFTGITGYVKGFASMAVDNVVPLVLSAATIMTKGKVSKALGASLLAYGGLFMAKDVIGIGKPKEL